MLINDPKSHRTLTFEGVGSEWEVEDIENLKRLLYKKYDELLYTEIILTKREEVSGKRFTKRSWESLIKKLKDGGEVV